MNTPNHIAIIMDGNGRWGLRKFKNRFFGHKHGVENIKKIVEFCIKKKILNLTLYAFSKDNFKRSKKEVSNLFTLFKQQFYKNEIFFDQKNISVKIIGELSNLPKDLILLIKKNNSKKKEKINLNLNIAFNYSSKLELINSFKKILLSNSKINIKNIEKNLYTSRSNDPEILIRTGGQNRLSDFLLWQISYTEIFFEKKMWPDFKPSDLNLIIKKYKKIKRNFGS